MIKKRLIPSLFLAMVFIVSGCGYRLSNGGALPGHVTRVAVTMFQNRSFETGAETIFTAALIKELVQKSDAMVVDKSKADAVISGTIRSITINALARTSDDTVVERQVSAVLDLDLIDTKGKILWSVHNFSASDVFTVASSNVLDESSKREAIGKIATRVSERIIGRMRDQF